MNLREKSETRQRKSKRLTCFRTPEDLLNNIKNSIKTKTKMNINDFSIGVDIEPSLRFRDLDRKESGNFLTKIFTEKEMNYCFSKKAPAQHLAARFVKRSNC